MKEYSIAVTHMSFGGDSKTRIVTGSLEYLKDYFQYDLECGHSWEFDSPYKINTNPKSIKALVTNLNRASVNTGRSYAGRYYELLMD